LDDYADDYVPSIGQKSHVAAVFNEESLRDIERALGRVLPEDYRRLLLAYPFAPDSDRAQWDLYSDKDTIIEENQALQGGFFGQTWPDDWLVIGGDGLGNLYYLDLSRKPSPVFSADHERTAHSDQIEAEEAAPSVTVWIEQIQQEDADAMAWEQKQEQEAAEWKANKKWWQFW